jgi:hypothetical protein
MSHWYLGRPIIDSRFDLRDVVIDIQTDDSVGSMQGTIVFQGVTFTVTGQWAASGSVPGRNASAFRLSGSDGEVAPVYIAAAGIMIGPGPSPKSINMDISRASTTDGTLFDWGGTLTPIA